MKRTNLMKHLQVIASKKESRPILKGIHYNTDGSLEVTDSHRLIKLHHRHTFKESATLDALTLETLEGNYPDLSNILIHHSEYQPYTLTAYQLKQLKSFLTGIKKNSIATLSFLEKTLTVTLESGASLTLNVDASNDSTIHVNATYLKDATAFMVDTQVTHVTLGYRGSLRPISFHVNNYFDYLVTPVRKN